MTPTDRTVDLLLLAARLKRLQRTGWVMSNVANPETIAAHSYGTVLITLLLLDLIDEPLDRAKALAMAVIHDLPEAVLGDVPTPATRHMPQGCKAAAEAGILGDMCEDVPAAANWCELWEEFAARKTREALLVNDADKLDMFLQATIYGNNGHSETARFWGQVDHYPWTFAASQELLEGIGMRRRGMGLT